MASTSAPSDPTQAVTAFARRFAAARGRPLSVLAAMADAPAVLDAVRHIRALPRVSVPLSPEGAGAEIRDVLGRRTLGIPTGRLAQAVLVLPVDADDYLKGRHRQALRTNLNHAKRLGMTASRVFDGVAYLRGVERVLTLRGMSADAIADLLEQHRVGDGAGYLACSADDVPLAFASWTVDEACALLRVQMTAWAGRESAVVRYALHLALVRDLVTSGVRFALAGSVLPLDAGHRYFQSLLGFEVVNLRLGRLATGAGERRSPATPMVVDVENLASPVPG